jgi:hypothetical protein
MGLIIHKKKFTAVTSCTLIHGQVDGTDPLHLEMLQLVEEAIQHVRKLLNTFATNIVTKYVYYNSYYHYKPHCLHLCI